MGKKAKVVETSIIPTINLAAKRNPKWMHASQAKALLIDFRRAGFAPIGAFAVREMPEILMQALQHESEPVLGIISEHPLMGIWFEMLVHYPNGDGLTVSDSQNFGKLDPMPGQVKQSLPGESVEKVFSHTLGQLRPNAVRIDKEDFPVFFSEEFRREQEWRAGKGFSEKEIQRIADGMEHLPDGETIRKTTQVMNRDYSLPCGGVGLKRCPYAVNGDFELMMPGMPALPRADKRCCPENGKICLEFIGQIRIDDTGMEPVSVEEFASVMADNPVKSIDITRENGDMKKAVAKALAQLPSFLERYRARPKQISDFMVRLRFKRKGKTLYLWARLTGISKGGFKGRIAHAAGLIKSLRIKPSVAFGKSRITDWTFQYGGFWHGHFTGPVLLQRLQSGADALEKEAQKPISRRKAKAWIKARS